MKLRLVFTLVAAFTFNPATHAALRTVALTGQQAPGAAAGANFTHLSSTTTTAAGPVINNAGRVAFAGQAMISGGATSTGIWSDATGTLAAAARSGTPAPGTTAGTNFSTFKNPLLSDAGRSSFDATVNTASATNTGIWADGGGGLSLVARKGSPAPGVGAGVNFFTQFAPSVNDSGQTAFRAQLSGAGITADNDVGIWAEKAGTLTLMARTGSAAPGTPGGVNFDSFPLPPVLINAAGQIAFRGHLTGPGVVAGVNRTGIWAERAGALSLIVREGSPVTTVAGANFGFIDDPALNRHGQTAFVALMSGVPGATNAAVFSEGFSSFAVAARKGSAAPGTLAGVNFASFSTPLLNGDGQVAFTAGLSGAGVTLTSDTGIWSQRGGVLNLVAREGSQAPGAAAGINFSTFASPVLNSASQMAFTATLTGAGVTTANDGGIWAQGLGGDLRLVAREGSPLEVSPGVNRTIAELHFAGGATTEDGRRVGFNDLGEVAFLATFTDGSSGLFVSDVAKAAAGDFNGDGQFDGSDFLVWQRGLGRTGTGLPNNGDANADGNVNAADLAVWRAKFGTAPASIAAAPVPEPATLVLGIFATCALTCISRASRSRPS